ncbi:MAG: glycosyltransferase [Oscillospiraceae bacterium]|nr:glycosyltransferase [Oscillospiraceae bacterium]
MILFNLTFPDKEICTEQEMYLRDRSDNRNGVGYVEYIAESGQVVMSQNARVSLDTFFNCFSYSRYLKYTNISILQVTLLLRGVFKIRLFMRRNGGIPELLAEQTADHNENKSIRLELPLAGLSGEGYIYPEIQALSDGAVFSGGHYSCPESESREIRLAVVICSYRREHYVYHNTAMLGRYLSLPQNRELRDRVSLIIVDNGHTLEQKKLAFDSAQLFYNRNLGGSGGFARGMIEAARSREGFTHMCLMDDDVRFDPEILRRTVSFLSITREGYGNLSVGGIMLELERPYNQYEMGGVWTGRRIYNMRGGCDMRLTAEVLANETEIPAGYNAWWYMCMPVSFVKSKGLPLPLFIKGDDMDYGMRTAEGIVLMNGIAVWHEGFDRKHNSAMEYYIKRNELILNALHKPKYGMLRELLKLLSSCGKQIVLQRYAVVDIIIRAYEDFLKGADFLSEVDAEKLNRELMGLNIPMLDDDALAQKLKTEYPGIQFQPKPKKRPHRLRRILTLYSYLIPRAFYSKAHKYRILELTDDFCPVDFYKSEHVIQYNSDTHRGFITTLRKTEAVLFGFKFLKICGKMLLGHRKAVKSYQEKWRALTGMKSWLERLGLDREGDDTDV